MGKLLRACLVIAWLLISSLVSVDSQWTAACNQCTLDYNSCIFNCPTCPCAYEQQLCWQVKSCYGGGSSGSSNGGNGGGSSSSSTTSSSNSGGITSDPIKFALFLLIFGIAGVLSLIFYLRRNGECNSCRQSRAVDVDGVVPADGAKQQENEARNINLEQDFSPAERRNDNTDKNVDLEQQVDEATDKDHTETTMSSSTNLQSDSLHMSSTTDFAFETGMGEDNQSEDSQQKEIARLEKRLRNIQRIEKKRDKSGVDVLTPEQTKKLRKKESTLRRLEKLRRKKPDP